MRIGPVSATRAASPSPPFRPAPKPSALRRKCSCGGTPGPTGECEVCRRKRLGLQRRPSSPAAGRRSGGSPAGPGRSPAVAPPIVHRALAAPGRALDPRTRTSLEARFGHDLSRVRVHDDRLAAASARSVAAEAYTVGPHVVFAAGRYRPASATGRTLLAHEVAHVVQQGPAPRVRAGTLPVGDPADPAEREADSAARGAGRAGSSTRSGGLLRRQPTPGAQAPARPLGDTPRPWELEGPCDTACAALDSMRRAADGICRLTSETDERCVGARGSVSAGEARTATAGCRCRAEEPLDKAGRPLTEEDRRRATEQGGGAAPSGTVRPAIQGARFVLHDTAAAVGATRIAEVAGQGRRSAGVGAGAWVPRAGGETVSHSPLFGPRRPTASEFERGQDVMAERERHGAYRRVWRATGRTQREAALDAVLAAQGSPAAEARRERRGAVSQGRGAGAVMSAATWAVEDVCSGVAAGNAATLAAAPARVTELQDACAAIATLTATRRGRIGATTNVEIVQERGSDCRTTGTLTPLQPYTNDQYDGVKRVYLRAALAAGRFPEVTTHFLIDRGIGDHCDPRCFDLGRLYTSIQTALGHRTGSRYGVVPAYGTSAPANVWWHDTVCQGTHP